MTTSTQAFNNPSSVIALHCSLGSAYQWRQLADELTANHQVITPDISGYGNNAGLAELPTTFSGELEALGDRLREAVGPIHLVGHSYGGALAFKIATDSALASRIRSLTLIEPVLPTMLLDSDTDRPLCEEFADLGKVMSADVSKGASSEALEKFLAFWKGSGPTEEVPPKALARMVAQTKKLAFEYKAIFAEKNISTAAAAIRVPTLLVSGGLSPHLTQRIVARLASIIPGAETRYLAAAGHMLPISHASIINPEITRHIARAEESADLH
jgi:pimeloyl-ACP methyl ester carboxylesterase